MPKISIIIPVYNTQAYLPKCLDSVFSQTFQDFEVIVVNDGSPDNSQTIIDRYKEKYPHKLVAICQENAGLSAARNTGIDAASGDFLMFLDSDDYIHPETFATAYTHAVFHDLDIVCFSYFTVCNDKITPIPGKKVDAQDPITHYVLNSGFACSKLVRRKLFSETGLRFSVGLYYEDLDLTPRLALYTDRIGFLDVPLYYYLIREGSIMQQKKYNPKLNTVFTVMEHLQDAFAGSAYIKELEYLHITHFLHDATLRFLPFPEGRESIDKIVQIMRKKFPHWQKNKYYKALDFKYQLVCFLIYHKQLRLLKLLLQR